MAERNGGALRRVLFSADCLRASAIFFGSAQVNPPSSRSRAWLSSVTLPDQRAPPDESEMAAIHYPSSEVNSKVYPRVSQSLQRHCLRTTVEGPSSALCSRNHTKFAADPSTPRHPCIGHRGHGP